MFAGNQASLPALVTRPLRLYGPPTNTPDVVAQPNANRLAPVALTSDLRSTASVRTPERSTDMHQALLDSNNEGGTGSPCAQNGGMVYCLAG